MSQEVYIKPGIPDSEDKIKIREENSIQNIREDDRYVLNERQGHGLQNTFEEVEKEQDEFIDMIDFDTLHDIFAELVGRSTGSKTDINFLGREDVVLVANKTVLNGAGGMFAPGTNFVKVWFPMDKRWDNEKSENINDYDLKKRIKIFGSKELMVFDALVHEMSHAASKNICIGENDYAPGYSYQQSGYARDLADQTRDININEYPDTKDGLPAKGSFFRVLNEGVTDKIGHQVALEYLKKEGWPQKEASKYRKLLEKINTDGRSGESSLGGGYESESMLVDELINLIAQDTGTSEEAVWQSIIEGYFSGRGFFDDELVKQWFIDTLGKNFVELLSITNLSFGMSKNKRDMVKHIQEAISKLKEDSVIKE